MSDRDIEKLLSRAPTRTLSPEELDLMAAALNAANRSTRRGWWRRRVPLGYAAAASAVAVAAALFVGIGLGRSDAITPVEPSAQPPVTVRGESRSTLVQAAPDLFRVSRPAFGFDLSRWQATTPR